jgi:large subunit ribosomal protein L22
MAAQATAKNITISSKKLKWIVSQVRGRPVRQAMDILRFSPSPAGLEIAKVVKSAAANAENNLLLDPDALVVIAIYANEGPTTKRFMPRARGRAGKVNKRSSHVTVVVDQEA